MMGAVLVILGALAFSALFGAKAIPILAFYSLAFLPVYNSSKWPVLSVSSRPSLTILGYALLCSPCLLGSALLIVALNKIY
jgi:hypothetical protein